MKKMQKRSQYLQKFLLGEGDCPSSGVCKESGCAVKNHGHAKCSELTLSDLIKHADIAAKEIVDSDFFGLERRSFIWNVVPLLAIFYAFGMIAIGATFE
jgi:hypothetical protein